MINLLESGSLKDPDPPVRVTPKFTIMDVSINTLLDKLKDGSDKEIQEILLYSYNNILNYDLFLSNASNREVAQKLFCNERFLDNLCNVLMQVPLNDSQKTCCNKLIYDYIAKFGDDSKIAYLHEKLSSIVNINAVLALSAIIPLYHARYLAIVRRAAFNESKNVIRTNAYITNTGLGMGVNLTTKLLIDVYSKLFTSVSDLFAFTMLNPYFGEDKDKMQYSRCITNAIASILVSMPSQDIFIVLSNYSSLYITNGKPKVRFSIKEAYKDNDRMNNVLKELYYKDIYVP